MGRYVFTPEIFDALDRIEPGTGGELQLTDAIGLLLETQTVYGRTFEHGRFDIGQKLDFLYANVELALDRADLGPEFAGVSSSTSCTGAGWFDRATPGRSLGGCVRWPRSRPRSSRRSRSSTSARVPIGAALGIGARVKRSSPVNRSHPSRTPRWTGTQCVRPTPQRRRRLRRSGSTSSASSRPVGRRPSPSGSGEAIRIMTGAPMPSRCRRDRHGRAHRARRRRLVCSCRSPASAGDHVRAVGGDVVTGDHGVRRRDADARGARRCARDPRVHRGRSPSPARGWVCSPRATS